MAVAQSVGIIDIYWNGVRLDMEKGANFRLPGLKNNAVNAGRRGYRSQEWVIGECNGTTVLAAGQSATAFSPGPEGELQIVCDTGQTYTSPDAFITDQPPITGGDGGKVAIKWNFSTYTELLS